ncbi:uncharacterized protein FOMMEDRAFT_160999 [Fomitiporia mediterranea MF3/22]|uniref:uncharacterized protein n=1 Tax=Fomitiporia mediterranea (strain MF3/22) TaxID=694068 RepID=UPI0004408A9B|nr:uncharacterized protein FOMMEDRAFT_160999 [Fomitiporia mediterranea MF3/22]EJC99386.1 hypothetical protein FOMMEDRAFT_160999 [Fomitiporia mediterranea MF3/22]
MNGGVADERRSLRCLCHKGSVQYRSHTHFFRFFASSERHYGRPNWVCTPFRVGEHGPAPTRRECEIELRSREDEADLHDALQLVASFCPWAPSSGSYTTPTLVHPPLPSPLLLACPTTPFLLENASDHQ